MELPRVFWGSMGTTDLPGLKPGRPSNRQVSILRNEKTENSSKMCLKD